MRPATRRADRLRAERAAAKVYYDERIKKKEAAHPTEATKVPVDYDFKDSQSDVHEESPQKLAADLNRSVCDEVVSGEEETSDGPPAKRRKGGGSAIAAFFGRTTVMAEAIALPSVTSSARATECAPTGLRSGLPATFKFRHCRIAFRRLSCSDKMRLCPQAVSIQPDALCLGQQRVRLQKAATPL
jgi:hypothetical protein